MLRTIGLLAAVGGSLAACGGGGSNGDTGTGVLTTAGPTLRDAATEGTFVSTPVGVSLNDSDPRFSLAADDTITVSLGSGDTIALAPGDAVVTADSGVVFFANNGNADGGLIATPGQSTLDYTAYGLWIQGASADLLTVNGNFAVADAGAGHFGVPTGADSMPSTGSANYNGAVVGAITQGNQINDLLNGNLQATADFANSTLDISMDISRANGGDFATLSADGVAIDASASAFRSSNDGATTDTGHVGSLRGSFYGPGAAEIGGQFDLDDGSTRILGAFGARQ